MSTDRDHVTTLHALRPRTTVDAAWPAAARAAAYERLLRERTTRIVEPTPPPRRAARIVPRLALAGGVLAAVTAGVVVLPALTGDSQAFATWTADPAGMSEQERADAAAGCHQVHEGVAEYADDLSRAEAVVAERRGVWSTVVLAGTDGFSALCITDDSANLFSDSVIGSIGTPAGYAAPAPRDLVARDLGSGTMDAGALSLAAGAAGSDVVGVTYRSQTHGDVSATVSGGHFALWFPGDELEGASSGVDVEVTYRDGSTSTVRLSL